MRNSEIHVTEYAWIVFVLLHFANQKQFNQTSAD